MDINMEEGTATFSISEVGTATRSTYMGNFKVHCILSPIDLMSADRDYRAFVGNVNPNDCTTHVRNLAFALSQLKYRIIEEPPFWTNPKVGGGHLKDTDVIISVLNLALEAEESYRQSRKKEAEEIQNKLTERVMNYQPPDVAPIEKSTETNEEEYE